MSFLKTEIEYEAISSRIEELLKMVDNKTSSTNKYLIELNILSNLVADYEEEYYPIQNPYLFDNLQKEHHV